MDFIIDIETTGLQPLRDRIIAIGVSTPTRTEIFHDMNEGTLLWKFWDYFRSAPGSVRFVGFNVDFDWNFLRLRSLRHQVKIIYPTLIDMRQILNDDRYAPGTLKEYAAFFGFDINDSHDGKDVPELWSRKQIKPILAHLNSDVMLSLKIWQRIEECMVV